MQRALALHPDRLRHGGASADRAAFVQLLTAYRVLGDQRARQKYNLGLKLSVRAWPLKDAFAQPEEPGASTPDSNPAGSVLVSVVIWGFPCSTGGGVVSLGW